MAAKARSTVRRQTSYIAADQTHYLAADMARTVRSVVGPMLRHAGRVQYVDEVAARAYGQTQPEFGGLYFDGDRLIMLFTADLDRHRQALALRVSQPEQLSVKLGTRSWSEVEDINRRLQHRLLTGPTPVAGVNSVGIGMSEGQFVICVGVDHHDDVTDAAVRRAASPHAVVITQHARGRHHDPVVGPTVSDANRRPR